MRPMHRWGLALAAMMLATSVWARQAAYTADYDDHQPALASGSLIQDKNFYLLTLLNGLPDVHAALGSDAALRTETIDRRTALAAARTSCAGDPGCLARAFLITDAEAERLADRLAARLQATGLLHPLAAQHLRPGGRFARFQAFDDAGLVRAAYLDAVHGLNRIVHVYGLGEAPLYPLIDGTSYPLGDKAVEKMWKDAVGDLVDVELDEPAAKEELFFTLELSEALALLDMNDRDEAARNEPLATGENTQAFAYAKTVDWRRWPYPVLLIPGRSPVLKDNPLSPEAKMKLRLAARRFAQGRAPIIVVSGGYVAPMQTRFAEALEMKKALMHDFGLPERAILVDPFARHTTTNLRNTARLMVEAGAPVDRPILVTTTDYQSRYIEAPAFQDRCKRELGYACFSDFKRLSRFDTEVRLPLTSLQRDAGDPLDP